MGSVLALLALCRYSGADEIELVTKAINGSLLTGEPLILSVSVRTDVPMIVPPDLTPSHLPLRILVDRGGGFLPYVEDALVETELSGPGSAPASVTREFVLSVDKATGDWTFPIPGEYRLVAEYKAPGGPAVRSNVVTVSVRAPAGAEREVYSALRQLGPGLVATHSPALLEEPLETLIVRYPGSAYLQHRRLGDLKVRISDVCGGYEAGYETLESGTPENPPTGPDMRPETVAGRARDLLPLALDVSSVAGPFQPNGLLTLANLYNIAGQPERASEVYERIARDFSDREAGRIAHSVVRDHVPPTLRISASPGSLWPPNHKFVLISATITVSDDMDPSPAVALDSITCDDGCDAAQDIAGAELCTDDREFELRAERKGSNTWRTYAITYSATDASGNQAKAVTTVVVPHDQGKR